MKYYDNFNPIHRQEPIPSFENSTHIITPCTSHKDLWTFTSKKDPIKMFCITAGLQWIRDTCKSLCEDASPLRDHFKKSLVISHSNRGTIHRKRTRFS